MLHRLAAAVLCATALVCPSPVDAGESYSLGVMVRSNARGKVPRKSIELAAKVMWSGPEAELRYHWAPVTGGLIPYGVDTRKPELVLNEQDLVAGEQYHLRLTVTAEYQPKDEQAPRQTTEATHDVQFEINAPPTAGDCELEAQWLPGSRGLLKVSATGWKDEDGAVRYRYTLVRDGERRLLQSWTVKPAFAIGVAARPGDRMQVECEARDLLGDITGKLSREVVRTDS